MTRKPLKNKGERFGKLTIIEHAFKDKNNYYLCQCDCGNTITLPTNRLNAGTTISCGCYRKEKQKEGVTTHGLSHHRLYLTWSMMKDRCNNPNNSMYHTYGNRGIAICNEWNNVENFINDMYPSFQEGLTLDRIDNNGNYCKSNCKWSTPKEQANNKSNNVIVEYYGIKMTLSQAIEKLMDTVE